MIVTLPKGEQIDLSQPIDISIPMHSESSKAWYVPPVQISPVRSDNFIGRVSEGGSVNFNAIKFNPHGNGTHTECVGHITSEFISINQTLKVFHFKALLISILPQKKDNGDRVITKCLLEKAINNRIQTHNIKALVIRTLPNDPTKLTDDFSGSNWAYLSEDAALYINKQGIEHLLIDTPSVDREQDEGKLLAHKAFWGYPKNTRLPATITEMIFVPNGIKDGIYFLNLQIVSFENDASPSKPVLYSYL